MIKGNHTKSPAIKYFLSIRCPYSETLGEP
jgi:hypothetical protein